MNDPHRYALTMNKFNIKIWDGKSEIFSEDIDDGNIGTPVRNVLIMLGSKDYNVVSFLESYHNGEFGEGFRPEDTKTPPNYLVILLWKEGEFPCFVKCLVTAPMRL